MAWNSLANNQLVTEEDASQSPIPLKAGQSHGSGNRCMTKTEMLTKYNVNPSSVTLYSSNQLVPKSGWVPDTVTFPYQVDFYDTPREYTNTASIGCTIPPTGSITYYFLNSPLGIGTQIFMDSALTQPFYQSGTLVYYMPNTNQSIVISSNAIVQEIYQCPTPIVTESFLVSNPQASLNNTCFAIAGNFIYIETQVSGEPTFGDRCYTDTNGTNIFIGDATKFYKLEKVFDSWRIKIDSTGIITQVSLC